MSISETPEENLHAMGAWAALSDAYEHALVILAMNLECQVMESDGHFSVLADPTHRSAIQREFHLYDEEQSAASLAPPPPPDQPLHPLGIPWITAWAAILSVILIQQGKHPEITERFTNSSQQLIQHHEWWRPFTALFLHADAGHLLGNLAIGGIFCAIAARTLGAALAWPLILAAGTIGNAVNAWSKFPSHFQSIGASTATFAALGLLVGNTAGIAWKSRSTRGMSTVFIPIIAGFILLGWYGTGGENTDVTAHFLGAISGVALGAIVATIKK